MKKLLTFQIIFILLMGMVSASAFATIGMQGLSFASSEIAEAVNLVTCASSPILCVKGKIVGQVQGELLQSVAEVVPEAVEAFTTYNQVQGYIDLGAEITNELQVEETGQITGGTINFEDVEAEIGKELGFENSDDVFVKNVDVEFNQEEGFNQINFQEEGVLWIEQNGQKTNFENIQEQTEYMEAFIKLDEKGNIIETDFTTNENGGRYTIGNDFIHVPPNSRVLFKDGKMEILIPYKEVGETNFKLPSSIDSQKEGNIIGITGKNVRLIDVQGSPILNEGTISIKNGQMYIPDENEAIINSINIRGGFLDEDTNLYFDGLKHSDDSSYVSFGPDSQNLLAEGNFVITPLLGNSLLSIEDDDFVSFSMTKSLLSIQRRDDLNLIPEVNIIFKEGGVGTMVNGDNIIHFFRDGDMEITHPKSNKKYWWQRVTEKELDKRSSSRMDLYVENEKGISFLGTKDNPHKLIFSEYNEFRTFTKDFKGESHLSGEIFGEVFKTYSIGNILEPRIYFSADSSSNLHNKGVRIIGAEGTEFEGRDPRDFLTAIQIKELDSKIAFIPKEVLGTSEIIIYPDDYWNNDLGNIFTLGFVDPEIGSDKFHIPKGGILRSGDTFYHENIHTWQFTIEGSKWEKAWLELEDSSGEDILVLSGIAWEDGSSFDPRYGFVGPYDLTSKFESVADLPPYVIENPAQYSKLIDPKSNFYRKKMGKPFGSKVMGPKMAREWSDIYLGKLALSRHKGLITATQYNKVVSHFTPDERVRLREREIEILESIGYF